MDRQTPLPPAPRLVHKPAAFQYLLDGFPDGERGIVMIILKSTMSYFPLAVIFLCLHDAF